MTAPDRVRLYGDDHAHRPHASYDALRAHGPLGPAEIAPGVDALVVTCPHAALRVLHDTATYSKSPSHWTALHAGRVPDSHVVELMRDRGSALYADGARHARLRAPIDDCLARIRQHRLRATTRAHAGALLDVVLPTGEADLMVQYADLLPLLVFAELFGCDQDTAARMVTACQGMIAAGAGAQQAGADLVVCLMETMAAKRTRPGADIVSWMLEHPEQLTDMEIVNNLVIIVGAGTIPTAGWIGSTLKLLLDEDPDIGDLVAGVTTIKAALEKVLRHASPMANFAAHYAIRDTDLDGTPVPRGVPILISHAATGTDPASLALPIDNRSHLAWSAGPHRCPAVHQATAIAEAAVETALVRLWDLRLARPGEHIPYRPGPFHQALAALPVRFRPRASDFASRTASTTGGITA